MRSELLDGLGLDAAILDAVACEPADALTLIVDGIPVEIVKLSGAMGTGAIRIICHAGELPARQGLVSLREMMVANAGLAALQGTVLACHPQTQHVCALLTLDGQAPSAARVLRGLRALARMAVDWRAAGLVIAGACVAIEP